MKKLWIVLKKLSGKVALTPEQADRLAQIKFPCC